MNKAEIRGKFHSSLDRLLDSIETINYDLGLVYLEGFIDQYEMLKKNVSDYHDYLNIILIQERIDHFIWKLEKIKEKEEAFNNLDKRIEKYLDSKK